MYVTSSVSTYFQHLTLFESHKYFFQSLKTFFYTKIFSLCWRLLSFCIQNLHPQALVDQLTGVRQPNIMNYKTKQKAIDER